MTGLPRIWWIRMTPSAQSSRAGESGTPLRLSPTAPRTPEPISYPDHRLTAPVLIRMARTARQHAAAERGAAEV